MRFGEQKFSNRLEDQRTRWGHVQRGLAPKAITTPSAGTVCPAHFIRISTPILRLRKRSIPVEIQLTRLTELTIIDNLEGAIPLYIESLLRYKEEP